MPTEKTKCNTLIFSGRAYNFRVLFIPEHMVYTNAAPVKHHCLRVFEFFDDGVQEIRSIRKVLEEGIPMISHESKPTKAGDGCQALFTFFFVPL
jgi:hypothetical protein